MSTGPGNDDLAQGNARQIEQTQAIKAEQKEGQQEHGFELDPGQKVEVNEINARQAKSLAKELNQDNERGDPVKQARMREIAERFKEKAAKDRELSRILSR